PMTRDEAIDCLIQQLDKHGYINDCLTLKDAIVAREAEATTAIGMNVAIPHAKSAAVKEPVVAVLQHQTGVKWDSLDGS
ncbi:PTS sugar transporter subunit IIA, partial [Staphylococcus caprae]